MSTDLGKAKEIAEIIRNEPYHLLTNDCILKSIKLKRACTNIGIPVKVVLCLGLSRARWFSHQLTIPVIHAWGEVEGHRVETSRPVGTTGIWGIIPAKIKPIMSVKF